MWEEVGPEGEKKLKSNAVPTIFKFNTTFFGKYTYNSRHIVFKKSKIKMYFHLDPSKKVQEGPLGKIGSDNSNKVSFEIQKSFNGVVKRLERERGVSYFYCV